MQVKTYQPGNFINSRNDRSVDCFCMGFSEGIAYPRWRETEENPLWKKVMVCVIYGIFRVRLDAIDLRTAGHSGQGCRWHGQVFAPCNTCIPYIPVGQAAVKPPYMGSQRSLVGMTGSPKQRKLLKLMTLNLKPQ